MPSAGGNGSGPDVAHGLARRRPARDGAGRVLPDRCVKTDLPADGRTVDVAAVARAGRYWLLVLNPIVYLAVARAVGTRWSSPCR